MCRNWFPQEGNKSYMRRRLSQYGNTRSGGLGLSSQFRIDRSLPPHLAGYIRSRCKVLRIRRMEEVVVVVVAEADLVAVRVGQMAVSKVRAAIRARVAVGAVGSRGVAAVQLVLPSRWTLSQRFGFGLQESPSLHFQELACSRFRIAIG